MQQNTKVAKHTAKDSLFTDLFRDKNRYSERIFGKAGKGGKYNDAFII